ncbi:MAG TPA: nucleoside-diphosphate sugar epimerase/dehydratase [Terriglobia bacterium]|nr:nucleoside-diphosphate sugar epimerase/dehydratase [Terriglobia bacterium]
MRKLRFSLYTTANQRLIDALASGLAFYLAYQLRFDGHVPAESLHQLWLVLPALIAGQILLNSALGLYRLVWRYIGLADALILARGYILSMAILLAARFGLISVAPGLCVPVSICILYFVLAFGGSVGVRALRRLQYEGMPAKAWNGKHLRRLLLIGAGRAGAMLAKEIACRTDVKPVGFLDDDRNKVGSLINGLPVLGSIDSLAVVAAEHDVDEVIICMAKVHRNTLKKVWAICESIPVRARIVPAFEDILQGKANIAAYRDVEINDLLGREPLELRVDDPQMLGAYRGRRILITGGGGSIGSELACQLAGLDPQEIVLLDKDENGLNDACIRLRTLRTAASIYPVVADLRLLPRLQEVFSRFRPEIVFHAAAHKHVYLMEMNPCEAVLNNVFGTRNLIEEGVRCGMRRFVLVSTDKAVKPSCVMGATKRLCEMLVQVQRFQGSQRARCFCCVRFGNVIGSRGSVVPIFQKQIARGGPITLTHPDVERFLMTIPEAVSLLIQAGTLGAAGEIFVLDMGEPVRIVSLARNLIELSGLRPGLDIPIQITSLKSGEKLREELVDTNREELAPTAFEKVGRVRSEPFEAKAFIEKLSVLEAAAWRGNAEGVLRIIEDFGIGFRTGIVSGEAPSPSLAPDPKRTATGSTVALPELAAARP